MAKVTARVSEKIFNISAWRGVNEAAEGEASLKLGEAAEMRNFCVTSGGALKKRPGSRNVAGLQPTYPAYVRENSERLAATDVGEVTEGRELYPRAASDSVGNVIPAGEPVAVRGEDAGQYAGRFFKERGETYELTRCVVTPGEGPEAISGGRGRPGELTRAFFGGESTGAFSGVTELETYDEAYISASAPGVRGAVTVRKAPEGTEPGWSQRDAGGWFLREGVLYKYYGARLESCTQVFRWRKYKCLRAVRGYTYYTEGPWEPGEIRTLDPGEGLRDVYTGYNFSAARGIFNTSGVKAGLRPGISGTYYTGGGSTITRLDVRTEGGSLICAEYVRSAQGPFTGERTDYSPGEYLDSVNVVEGEHPQEREGYAFEAAFSLEGTAYTVMRLGYDYFCYARDADSGVISYDRVWGFYGFPMALSPDRAEWYGNETYSLASGGTDPAVRGIWSGFVGGREVLCAACGGFLWELSCQDGVWSKVAAGEIGAAGDVHMFGFDEKLYLLNGEAYKVWDGEKLEDVEGYRPLVSVSVEPSGGGTLLEGINRLTPGRRCWFSPDGEATVFQLPETGIKSVDWVRDLSTGDGAAVGGGPYGISGDANDFTVRASAHGRPTLDEVVEADEELTAETETPAYTVNLEAGTVTFVEAPARGVNTLEIAWSAKEDFRSQVTSMRYAELYNGAQDTRVFLYGDGSNKALYSGLDHDGRPRADYFPDLYEVLVGDANTPVTALIRHYNKLLAFKLDSAWSIGYDTITLLDGTVTAGFYVSPVNRSIGNCAYGQAQLVQNRPRTLDGRSVVEWRATSSSGNVTGDQRNAERVSQRVDSSIRKFDLTKARTFYDKISHEYFVIGEDGTAIAQNMDVDAWYVYTGLMATCMINYRDELYYGTRDGYLRHFSFDYFSDNGEPIDAYWESGAMSFSEDFRRKYSAMIWIGIKPEDNGFLEVTAQTDRKSDFAAYDVETSDAGAVPEMERIRLKAKKFTYYKLILRNNTPDKTATVVSADMRVRGTGLVK